MIVLVCQDPHKSIVFIVDAFWVQLNDPHDQKTFVEIETCAYHDYYIVLEVFNLDFV